MIDIIDYKIHGDDMQIVEVELDPGEGVRAEAGAVRYDHSDGAKSGPNNGGGSGTWIPGVTIAAKGKGF